jgi:hypothetical protein
MFASLKNWLLAKARPVGVEFCDACGRVTTAAQRSGALLDQARSRALRRYI